MTVSEEAPTLSASSTPPPPHQVVVDQQPATNSSSDDVTRTPPPSSIHPLHQEQEPTPSTMSSQPQSEVLSSEDERQINGVNTDSSNDSPAAIFTKVKVSELYPLTDQIIRDEGTGEDLEPPFATLPGESVLYLGTSDTSASDGMPANHVTPLQQSALWVIALSNFRLHISELVATPQTTKPISSYPTGNRKTADSNMVLNVPLSCIETCEQRDLFYLHISCKDARMYRLQLETNSMCEVWHRRISQAAQAAAFPEKIQDVFALAHNAWAKEMHFEELGSATSADEGESSAQSGWFGPEISRLCFDVQGAWRTSLANKDHRLSPTYPPEILVPACVSDACLEKVAQFRSARRIPAVVWRHVTNGAVLARCSQPEVGWLGWRSADDEDLVKAIADASAFDRPDRHPSGPSDTNTISSADLDDTVPSLKDLSAEAASNAKVKSVLILDARSYAAAVGNRARGGGVECPEYYPNTEILFMNLANIHSIRKSFQALRLLCNTPNDQTAWFAALDATKWLHHVSGLIKAAVRVATALDVEGRPVIVHCSDGWDRTPQITALAELMLDPYYRSTEGFQVLVEKEWLDFGHKFADRNGSPFCTSDLNERSPIFLQWLDCVHQLLLQFPCSFEFNLSYLVKLAQHTYSNLFGTFLCNSLAERKQHTTREQTRSVWDFLKHHPYKFRNLLYSSSNGSIGTTAAGGGAGVLWPKSDVRDLLLWRDVYVSELRQGTSASAASASSSAPTPATAPAASTTGVTSTSNQSDDSSSRGESEAESQTECNGGGGRNFALVKEELQKLKVTQDLRSPMGQGEHLDTGQTIPAATATSTRESKNCEASPVRPSFLRRSSDVIETSTDTLCPDPLEEGEGAKLTTVSDTKKLPLPNGLSQPSKAGQDINELRSRNGATRSENCQNGPSSKGMRSGDNKSPCVVPGGRPINHRVKRFSSVSDDSSSICSSDSRQGLMKLSNTGTGLSEDSCSSSGVLDSDGLPAHHNEVQRRLAAIFANHESEVQHLRRDLYLTRIALCRKDGASATARNQTQNGDATTPGHPGNGGVYHGGFNGSDGVTSDLVNGGAQSTASDASSSWEAVDEKESKPTLWVPDHAAQTCASCHTAFWFGRRKHHCRNCGGVFCSECSDNLAPIPMEQLYHPVRICNSCYRVIHGPDTGTRQQLAPDNSPSQCQMDGPKSPGESIKSTKGIVRGESVEAITRALPENSSPVPAKDNEVSVIVG